jgi:hypothetical protein
MHVRSKKEASYNLIISLYLAISRTWEVMLNGLFVMILVGVCRFQVDK